MNIIQSQSSHYRKIVKLYLGRFFLVTYMLLDIYKNYSAKTCFNEIIFLILTKKNRKNPVEIEISIKTKRLQHFGNIIKYFCLFSFQSFDFFHYFLFSNFF